MPNPRMKQRRVVHKSTAGILKPIPEAVDLVGNPPPGCPFVPRCGYARPECREVDMRLLPVATSQDPDHVTACPFVLPDTPAPPAPPATSGSPAGELGT